MEILYDRMLTEDVVFLEIKRREVIGRDDVVRKYYEEHKEVYEKQEEFREKFFERLHEKFFLKFGFDKPLLNILSEFKEFKERIRTIIAFKALTSSQEEASLNSDSDKIGLRLHPEHFFNHKHFEAFLRHELKHISDMLDEGFGYKRRNKLGNLSPAQENVIRSRYKMIWDIFIDGRISREGEETVVAREERFREFEELYRTIPRPRLFTIFESVWNAEKITHNEILEMAKDAKVMTRRYSRGDEKELKEEEVMLPGALCPLCRFPTFNWTKNLHEEEESVLVAIKADYPWWDLRQGLCERCLEVYKLRGEWLRV
ncbi:MAG: hypothetical protein A2042_08760 [Candidatus Schekmanbacteria bacterium GWA2_38_11]|uniref:Uncharacterized protein n=1 Tax=Candidatus Schekmanbacteria bacterium GWA2_38_11 TaxID=1817876 RepID=A0A1F7RC41_9BACT|nr:MAG: hypothetical protein A2042_08760 [Candidatus Schekmanbacteria bacterium GWA2_38_11]